MIYVLEGPDGTGKTTLANEIARQVNGFVVHATYNKYWDMKAYHTKLMQNARELDESGISVILDRWAPSERVYGNVFREGESFSTKRLIDKYNDGIVWIYCWNENAAENHLKNKERREEMFGDMSKVAKEFDKYVRENDFGWIHYNFNHDNVRQFVKGLPRDER